MRLLISAGLFYPSKLGGPSKSLYWLAKGLISKGFNISVVTSNNFINKGLVEFDEWTIVDDIRIMYCSTKTNFSFKITWNTIKEIKNCDIVILSSIFYKPSFFIALYTLFTTKKLVWSPRGELYYNAIRGSIIKKLYIKILRFLFSRKVIFHATSLDEENNIKRHFGFNTQVFVIPNYMELPEKQKRICNSDKFLLYVGRIAPIKALDNVLIGLLNSKAFMKSDCRFLIAGSVEEQFHWFNEKLNKIIQNDKSLKNKVLFLGNVEDSEKYKLFAEAYFTILVSHSENFGNVVIEALSQGTPVIASKGTPWQKLKLNDAGFWIDNDVNSIAKQIDEILKLDNNRYKQIRENAFNLAKEFDIHTNIDKWINILNNYVNTSR